MSPYQYLAIKDKQMAIIGEAYSLIARAREEANKHPWPINTRPALAGDIRVGAVIWHKDGDEGPFWNVVEEERHYGDPFKAYVADDGCRYGLEGAYIDLDNTPNKLIRELKKVLR